MEVALAKCRIAARGATGAPDAGEEVSPEALSAPGLPLGRNESGGAGTTDRMLSDAHQSAAPSEAVQLNDVVARREKARVKLQRNLLARSRQCGNIGQGSSSLDKPGAIQIQWKVEFAAGRH